MAATNDSGDFVPDWGDEESISVLLLARKGALNVQARIVPESKNEAVIQSFEPFDVFGGVISVA